MTKMKTAGNIVWTMDIKVNLLLIDEEERKNGKGSMKRIKDRWDAMCPTLKSAVNRSYEIMLQGLKKRKRLPT